MTINILNPKQLEKQLKVLETRIQALQTEIDGLAKIRDACHVLLGVPAAPSPDISKDSAKASAGEGAKPKPPAKRARKTEPVASENEMELDASADLSDQISRLLKSHKSGMTADEIYDNLKATGYPLRGRRPVALVYKTLESFPERFVPGERDQWREASASGSH